MTKNLKYYLNLPYKTILKYEPDDNTWVAHCPELGRGSCYGIGESKSDSLSQLEEAKESIISFALEEGKEIPEPQFEEEELPSGNFIVRLPKTLHKKLKYNLWNQIIFHIQFQHHLLILQIRHFLHQSSLLEKKS